MDGYYIIFSFDLISNFLEFLIYIKYCSYYIAPTHKEHSYLRNFSIYMIYIILISTISTPFFWIITLCSTGIFNKLTYKIKLKNNIYHILRFNIFNYSAFSALFALTILVLDSNHTLNNDFYQNLKGVIIMVILYVIASLLLNHRKVSCHNIANPYKKFIYLLLSLIFLLLCAFVFTSISLEGKTEIFQNMTISIFLLSIMMIVLIITIYEKIVDFLHESSLQQLELQKYELNQDFYNQLSEKTKQLSSLKHDFKNHLTIISGWLGQKKYKELHDYLDSIMDYVDLSSDIVITKNQTISSILHAKKSQCDRLGIRFEYDLDFEEIYKICDMDLIIMLGNILDNAIEATGKTAEKNRYISLTMEQSKSYLIVSCQNSFKEKPIEKNGILFTTKKEKNIHGIGLSNIIETCKKYNGECKYQYDETIFQIQLLLPNY